MLVKSSANKVYAELAGRELAGQELAGWPNPGLQTGVEGRDDH